MATKIAAAGGGNWTAGATWVGGVAPLASDDAQLTGTSGNVTIDSGAVARSLDCTGYVGVLTQSSGVVLILGDATAGAGNIALKFVAGMTYTPIGGGSNIVFASTSATQQTITTAGKVMSNSNMGYATASSFLLTDPWTVSGTFTFSGGTFNTGNFACSWGLFVIVGAGAKTLTLQSSAITITGNSSSSVDYSGSNCTFTANTAVLTFTGANAGISNVTPANWSGASVVFTTAVTFGKLVGGTTLKDVTYTGPVSKTASFNFQTATITGTLTITGNSTVNRLLVCSSNVGTAYTVTAAAVSLSNVDFQDITAAGAAIPWTGTSMGNALGNSNITFAAPVTQTHTASAGGNWSDPTKWTSRVPLPQDNVVVDVNTTGTLTADMPRLGADVTFAGFAGTFALGVATTIYGSVNLASGMTFSGSFTVTFSARSAKTITSNGKAFSSLTITAPSGTYTLVDALSVTSLFNTTTAGTLASANFPISIGSGTVGSGTTAILGTSTFTITGTAVSAGFFVAGTVSAASTTFVYSTVSANNRIFGGAGNTFGTLTYTVPGSTGSLTITGNNTFNTINFSDASNARSLLFTAGTTTTVTNFNVFGTAGKLMTIDTSTGAGTFTLSKPTGTVSTDYLNITRSLAGGGAYWYAGANSTNGGTNTGWIFTAVPASTNFFFMF